LACRSSLWGAPSTTKTDKPTPAAADIVITLAQGSESKSVTMIKNTGYLP